MKGKIVKTEKNGQYGSTIWTLSNGTKVYIKKTDYKEDEILFKGRRDGGYYNFTKPSATELKVLNTSPPSVVSASSMSQLSRRPSASHRFCLCDGLQHQR